MPLNHRTKDKAKAGQPKTIRQSCKNSVFLCMSPTRSEYKELGLELVELLQDQPRKSRQPPMADEKKDEGVGDPIIILLEEFLE